MDYQISLDGKKFYSVEFESENLLVNNRYYGMWLFNKNSRDISFSIDGVYSTNISEQINYEYSSEYPQPSENDNTLIPLRFLFEQMGADVEWNGDNITE